MKKLTPEQRYDAHATNARNNAARRVQRFARDPEYRSAVLASKNPKKKSPIRAFRLRCEMTQEQFKERLGVSISSVRNWDNNRSLPSTTKKEGIEARRKMNELAVEKKVAPVDWGDVP